MQVRIYHYRVCVDEDGRRVLADWKQIREQGLGPLPHGGMTEAVVLDDDGETVLGEAAAYCSDKDQYNKYTGRVVASNKALFPIVRPEEAARRKAEKEAKEGNPFA